MAGGQVRPKRPQGGLVVDAAVLTEPPRSPHPARPSAAASDCDGAVFGAGETGRPAGRAGPMAAVRMTRPREAAGVSAGRAAMKLRWTTVCESSLLNWMTDYPSRQ